MYPNYFFNASPYKGSKYNIPVGAVPGVKEKPQYGVSNRVDNKNTQANNNNSLLDLGPLTPPLDGSLDYTQGYLRTQIGKYVKVDFLIGTNRFIDKEGILRVVGISYIVLEESGSGDMVMCDMYSIKFVTTLKKENIVIESNL